MLSEAVQWVQSITLEGERLSAGGVVVRRDAIVGARLDTPGVRLSFLAMLVLLVLTLGLSGAAFAQTLQFFNPDYAMFAASLVPVIGAAIGCFILRPRQHLSLILSNGYVLAMPSKDRAFLDLCLEAFERLWTDPERVASSLYIHAEHRSVDFGPALQGAGHSRPQSRQANRPRVSAAQPLVSAPVSSSLGPVPIPVQVPLADDERTSSASSSGVSSNSRREVLLPGIDLPIFPEEEAKVASEPPAEAASSGPEDEIGDKASAPSSALVPPAAEDRDETAVVDPAQAAADAITSALRLEAANDPGQKPAPAAPSEDSEDERVAELARALDAATIVPETPEGPSDKAVGPEGSDGSVEAGLAASAIEALHDESGSAEDAGEGAPLTDTPEAVQPQPIDADGEVEEVEASVGAADTDNDPPFKPIPAAAFDTVRSNVRTLARLLRQRSSSPALNEAIDTLERHILEGCVSDRERRALARSLSILRGRMTVYPAAIQVLDAVEVAAGLEDAEPSKASTDAA
ncbi:MAG: hypothetical protein AAF739_15255 [Pseudomonadota bacterium]